MIDYLLHSLPVVFVLVVYFVRIEVRFARITTDIDWIKKNLTSCLPPSDQSTQ